MSIVIVHELFLNKIEKIMFIDFKQESIKVCTISSSSYYSTELCLGPGIVRPFPQKAAFEGPCSCTVVYIYKV